MEETQKQNSVSAQGRDAPGAGAAIPPPPEEGKGGRKAKRTKKKEKKGPRWLRILKRVLLILVIVLVAFVVFSVVTIRMFTGDSLSFHGTLAMVGYGGMDLPAPVRNFILNVDRTYPGLPELLVAEDGSAVTSQEEYAARRAEILEAVEKYQYGVVPAQGFETSFELVESGSALDGTADRQQYRITVSTDQGEGSAMLLLYTPAGAESCPMILGENFSGNTTVWPDEAILPSVQQDPEAARGGDSSWPVDEMIRRGYGFATVYYQDWAADTVEGWQDAMMHLFQEDGQEYTAYSAWAFGFSRGVDLLESLEQPRVTAIATMGHSRLARASVWAAANDPRIDLAISSCGSGYQRSDILGRIIRDGSSDHWYTEAHFQFEDRDSEYPVDMHMLYALVADRHLYVSAGQNDLASDPISTYDALQNAKQVWSRIYQQEVIPDAPYSQREDFAPVFSQGVAFHLHREGHTVTAEDWAHYLDYMDRYVLPEKQS